MTFEHDAYRLSVTKSVGAAGLAPIAFMYGHHLYPGGLRLDGYREGMTRAEVKALAIEAADRMDAHYQAYRKSTACR